jgi:hypothetical protein
VLTGIPLGMLSTPSPGVHTVRCFGIHIVVTSLGALGHSSPCISVQ